MLCRGVPHNSKPPTPHLLNSHKYSGVTPQCTFTYTHLEPSSSTTWTVLCRPSLLLLPGTPHVLHTLTVAVYPFYLHECCYCYQAGNTTPAALFSFPSLLPITPL
ncbi:hypothetical protein Pcinc_025613 [Petrolisthes cinctipes]|uniref:Uncharacterized protein n=1 Tax=Petrolisthes cinctipes TaxID=88211 RepID=A0AAE1F8W5_PETCI|nr:hypothetical protein Pcinc_025613 [Petrolisthes cinctipes]